MTAQPERFAHVTTVDDLDRLEESARNCLVNPFSSRWGVECAEYDLMDLKARRAQLAGGTQ